MTSYELKSKLLKGGYIGHSIGDYCRADEGRYWEN